MIYQTLSELLIVSLCTISSIRVFFRVRSDATSILPYFTVLVSVANIFAWGINYKDITLLAISVTIALINIRSVLRLMAHLIVDHFSTAFVILNFFVSIICILIIVVIVLFSPVYTDKKNYNTTETETYYHLNNAKQPVPSTNLIDSKDIRVRKYGSPLSETNDKIILFVPGLTTDSQNYRTIFYKLSQKGYTVYTAEIYGKTNPLFENHNDLHFFRRSKCLNWEKSNPVEYNNFLVSNSNLLQNQYQILLDIINPAKENTVIACCDKYFISQIQSLQLQNNELIDGTFDIGSVPEYKTPGLGPIQETDPLNAYFMDIKRDPDMTTSNAIVTQIENYISSLNLQ